MVHNTSVDWKYWHWHWQMFAWMVSIQWTWSLYILQEVQKFPTDFDVSGNSVHQYIILTAWPDPSNVRIRLVLSGFCEFFVNILFAFVRINQYNWFELTWAAHDQIRIGLQSVPGLTSRKQCNQNLLILYKQFKFPTIGLLTMNIFVQPDKCKDQKFNEKLNAKLKIFTFFFMWITFAKHSNQYEQNNLFFILKITSGILLNFTWKAKARNSTGVWSISYHLVYAFGVNNIRISEEEIGP